jgi:hypothetical protein
LHTGIFSPRNRIIGLGYDNNVWSNQILFDRINQNQSLYLYPAGDIVSEGRTGQFHNNFRLNDPSRTAEEMARSIDAFLSSAALPPMAGKVSASLAPMPGALLSRNKPTMQSSVSEFSRADTPETDSAGAVNGMLTGSYQFHTLNEHQPWWQVDLGAIFEITGIRLFNRLDEAGSRSARFAILGSQDGEVWSELMRRENVETFGGLNGHPFEWTPPKSLTSRWIRVQLLGKEFLHLDQVEVWGNQRTEPRLSRFAAMFASKR